MDKIMPVACSNGDIGTANNVYTQMVCPDILVNAITKLPILHAFDIGQFQSLIPVLADDLTRRLLDVADLEERLIGVGNSQMMADNHLNHLRFIFAYLANPNPVELVSTARWAMRTYIAHGFRPDYWRVMLPQAIEVLHQRLPSEIADVIIPYYRFLHEHLEDLLPDVTDCGCVKTNFPHNISLLVTRYVELLLAGDRHQARSLIIGQAANGMSVRDIYLDVFSPAQRMLGQLWQENRISVAMEHFATAATQMIMSQLFPYIFDQKTSQKRLGVDFVGCCVHGELHEIGMRMVCDLLEIEGFDTWYLGANTPNNAILHFLAERLAAAQAGARPLILGVSCTLAQGVPLVGQLVKAVRSDPRLQRVKILVGGIPFHRRPDLWSKVGADAQAGDAVEAIQVVRRLANLMEIQE